jgi:RNA polymerase sigma-70 factor (ECF subfamily)
MQPANCGERGGRSARRYGDVGASAERFAAEALPHLGQLYPAALRMAGREPEAQELVLETYARAYAALGRRGDASITAWLYRNMARAAEESGLAQPCDPGEVRDHGSEVRDAGGEVPERREPPPCLDDAPGGDVIRAMHRVPARSRFAIYLADVEGFSASKIARILQLPASMVTARLRRGRRQLRAGLGLPRSQSA